MGVTTVERNRAARKIGTRASNFASYEDKARLHSDVIPEGRFEGCWRWFGYLSNGVPRVGRHPEDGGIGPVNLRVALLTETQGRPKDGHSVTVTCGNLECVNPEHLRWETKDEFFGRVASLTRAKRAKISDERFQQAKEWEESGISVTEVAARLGVARQTVYSNWKRLGLK
jgi:hypothetical protein